jgi:hypothetical protein
MNHVISWIAAQAECPDKAADGFRFPWRGPRHDSTKGNPARGISGQLQAAHQFPVPSDPNVVEEERGKILDYPLDRNPDLRAYRGITVAMLRRYHRFSLETGRLPSLLGCEFFRTKVTSYNVATLEDRVIFVHDMEMCVGRLGEYSRQTLARFVLQEHDVWETAIRLRCSEKTIRRNIPVAIDQLSEILIEVGLVSKLVSKKKKPCQGGKNDEFRASDCGDGK